MIQFVELLKRLSGAQLDFVVVGGVAATLHGASEPTRDLDVCITPSVDAWEKVAKIIAPLHPRFALTPDKRAIIPTVNELQQFKNLYVLTDLGRIDFLGEVPPLGTLESLRENAELMTLDEIQVRVIGLDDLLRVKEHVRRPKDLEVAAELRALRDAKSKRPR